MRIWFMGIYNPLLRGADHRSAPAVLNIFGTYPDEQGEGDEQPMIKLKDVFVLGNLNNHIGDFIIGETLAVK